MKLKGVIIIVLIVMVGFLTGCDKDNIKSIAGEYIYDGIVYMSALSSSSYGYLNARMQGTVYIINEKQFKNDAVDITQPIYKKVKIGDSLVNKLKDSTFGYLSLGSLSVYKDKYQYLIYDNDEKLMYYIYSMDDEVWVASYIDNTVDKSDVIMYIYRLKKTKDQ
ncbi:MAG TPA: hypothetical protein VN131_01935 [Mobilitalea sp.]|nr:hypothetical protein [Mobilitalea sp.]